jgi:hypothetical protein
MLDVERRSETRKRIGKESDRKNTYIEPLTSGSRMPADERTDGRPYCDPFLNRDNLSIPLLRATTDNSEYAPGLTPLENTACMFNSL